MSYLNEFISKIQKIDYPGFLTLWEEYCNSDQLDADELIAILEALRKSEMAANLGRHFERMLPLWETLQDKEKSYEVLKYLLDVQYAPSEVMANVALKALEDRYGSSAKFQDKLKMVGLRTKDKIQGCIRNFELLNHLHKGNFVFHPAGWGVGEILDVSFLREEFAVEFELVAGKKTLSFSTAYKTLEPISKEHILAMRFSQPDDLEAFAKKDPVAFMKKFFEELGPKTATEIKEELCDLVIPSDDWTKWWQQTRAKLKKDSMIDCPDDLKMPFRLRKDEVTHEERLKKLVAHAKDHTGDLINVFYSFFRDFPEALKNTPCVNLAQSHLLNILSQGHPSTAEEIMVYMIMEDIGFSEKKPALEALIKNEQDLVPVFADIAIISMKKRALIMIKAMRSDWKMLFELLLLHVDYNPLREFVFEELHACGASKELHAFIKKLMTHPYDAPDAFLWLFSKGMDDEVFLGEYLLTKSRLFEALLVLLSRIENSSIQKNLVKKIVAMIMDDRFALVREVMKESSMAEVKEFLLLSTKCHSFTDHELKIFQSLAEVVYPTLAKNIEKQSMGGDPNVIWCTQDGFSRMQKRVHHIATVETVENAKEIETARAHGDLRENAEFKAALERRDRLQQELKVLSDQLGLARVISKDDISLDEVGVGCVVDCVNANGEKITYKILGPWEADPDKKILSYQSKLAQAMGGKVKGDKFKFQDEELIITDIKGYLD
jgi:transcription elongation factor GreA-like protein/transcription elongation GreA/GreB family factor